MEQKQIFRNTHYLADVTGTGFWRHVAPITTLNCIQGQTGIFNTYTQQPICGPRFYVGMNTVTIQRWITKEQRNFVEKFLLPIFAQTGTHLIYEIDDCMGASDIPLYNKGREAFQSQEVQDNIKFMLNASDQVIVTTNHIKEYYHRTFGVPLEKIVALPNLLPRWWIGDRYDPNKKLAQFQHFKAKPRIGVVSSASHFNLMGITDESGQLVKDDLDEIVQTIRETVDDFQWVVFGIVPKQIEDLAKAGKVQCVGGVPIIEYPSALHSLQLQAVVAPILDNEFNHCKSAIKYLECSALGIPLFASRMLPYSDVMPDRQLFSTQDELKEKLKKLKYASTGAYGKCIEQQWKWLNSPRRDGDFDLRDSWMESNMGIYVKLSQMPPKNVVKPPLQNPQNVL